MSLPKINHPVFKITIPSTKKALSFRPYTVKEEKLIIMMKEQDNITDVVETLKQLINNCCVDKIDINNLALFDIEYIFVKLRSKSVGEEIELVYTDGEDKIKFNVDLDQVEVKFNPEHSKKIPLIDNYGITMRYPNYEVMLKLDQLVTKDSNVADINNMMFEVMLDCIENVYDDKQIYKDFTKEDLENFVLSLPMACTDKIKTFFDTMPSLEYTTKVKNKKGEEKDVTLRGLKDFFIF